MSSDPTTAVWDITVRPREHTNDDASYTIKVRSANDEEPDSTVDLHMSPAETTSTMHVDSDGIATLSGTLYQVQGDQDDVDAFTLDGLPTGSYDVSIAAGKGVTGMNLTLYRNGAKLGSVPTNRPFTYNGGDRYVIAVTNDHPGSVINYTITLTLQDEAEEPQREDDSKQN